VPASAVESCGASRYAGRPASDADGTVRVGSRILRRILVCLPAGFKCRTDVVLLLRDHFLAAIGPFLCLVFVLAGAFLHHVAALFRRRQQRVASLATGLGRIEDANRCANAQSRKKTQNAISAAAFIRHRFLLDTPSDNTPSGLNGSIQFPELQTHAKGCASPGERPMF